MDQETEADLVASEDGMDNLITERWLPAAVALPEFIKFVEKWADDGEDDTRRYLDAWRVAKSRYDQLRTEEAGEAEKIGILPLPKAMRPMARKLLKHATFVQGFGDFPTRVALVELGRMVAYQQHVALDHVRKQMTGLSPDMPPENLFEHCFPSRESMPPLKVREVGDDTMVFSSPSTDMRFLGAMLLEQGKIKGYIPVGKAAMVLGLPVGFGSNLLNALSYRGRLLLNNGYHRTVAMIEAGITHAPCVIQELNTLDELELAGGRVKADRAGYYFNSPRPPLMRDFRDPRLYHDMATLPREKQIYIRFEVKKVYQVQ
jgi:hypothetical protein